jgi:hypothetical protein
MVQVLIDLRYEQIVEAVDKLPLDKRRALLNYLANIERRALTNTEKHQVIDAVRRDIAPGIAFSDRRSDWYEDDGR